MFSAAYCEDGEKRKMSYRGGGARSLIPYTSKYKKGLQAGVLILKPEDNRYRECETRT